MDKMVSACYCEPLRIRKYWQDYKLKQLLCDKTLNPFPLREVSIEMVWQLPEISENKAGHILYYFDTVDQIPLCHCNYVYHNMVMILVSADIYTDEIMKNMSN